MLSPGGILETASETLLAVMVLITESDPGSPTSSLWTWFGDEFMNALLMRSSSPENRYVLSMRRTSDGPQYLSKSRMYPTSLPLKR